MKTKLLPALLIVIVAFAGIILVDKLFTYAAKPKAAISVTTISKQARVRTEANPVDLDIIKLDPLEQKAQVVKVTKHSVRTLVLEKDQVIPVFGAIGENGVYIADTITQMATQGKPLYILINSPGGSVIDGAQIVSAIQAAHVPVYTICSQICASMAAIIHQYGTKRLMVDRSILMFHNAAGGFQGNFPQMQSRFGFFNAYVNKMDAYIAKRNHQTQDQFMASIQNELWLDADDAIGRGYTDELVNIVLNFDPNQNAFLGSSMSQSKSLNPLVNVTN